MSVVDWNEVEVGMCDAESFDGETCSCCSHCFFQDWGKESCNVEHLSIEGLWNVKEMVHVFLGNNERMAGVYRLYI